MAALTVGSCRNHAATDDIAKLIDTLITDILAKLVNTLATLVTETLAKLIDTLITDTLATPQPTTLDTSNNIFKKKITIATPLASSSTSSPRS